ncbi:hypothetical protein CZ787_12765 [Halomonas citrativorans]|uniref:Uncharacterized protein n=1 Tax=Halomonas citrativorans TaxID=2742612 RepID=A0A1R4I2X9_9GAMM|nr:hypothetical protein CZ787_12765 [Halomonas citrativorans]
MNATNMTQNIAKSAPRHVICVPAYVHQWWHKKAALLNPAINLENS